MLRNPAVYQWRPVGLSDARDGKMGFKGGCKLLQNLIHDPVSGNMIAPRPGVVSLSTFSGFTTPGAVSLLYVVGPRVYGMVASGLNAGHDQPFCFDTSTNAFVTISGITSSNVPTTPATSGAWTPPTATLVGTKLVVTHPGFAMPNAFGWFDLSNPAAPVWNAGNMLHGGTTPVLTSIATGVSSFNNRAYYSVGNLVYFSDIIAATNQTDAGQVLTLGDSTVVTGFAPQGVSTATQGILQALLVFKAGSIWQITGDWNYGTVTGGNLALNQIDASVGCSAPLTIRPTPAGVMFMAPDGIRTIPPLSMVVGPPNQDVAFPFYNCTEPSRAVAAFSGNTYRISLDTVTTTDVFGRFEYWFSLNVNRWNGPHTFPASLIAPLNDDFVLASKTSTAQLFTSTPYTTSADVFVEAGQQMLFNMTSSLIDPDPPMSEKASIEMTVAAVWGTQGIDLQVLDAFGNLQGSATVNGIELPLLWGGSGLTWGGGSTWNPAPYNAAIAQVHFAKPLVVKSTQFIATGACQPYFRFARMDARYEALQYTGAD